MSNNGRAKPFLATLAMACGLSAILYGSFGMKDAQEAPKAAPSFDVYPVSWISKLDWKLAENKIQTPSEESTPLVEMPLIREAKKVSHTRLKKRDQVSTTAASPRIQEPVAVIADVSTEDEQADAGELAKMQNIYRNLRKGFVIAARDEGSEKIMFAVEEKVTEPVILASTQAVSTQVTKKVPPKKALKVAKAPKVAKQVQNETLLVKLAEAKASMIESLAKLKEIQTPIVYAVASEAQLPLTTEVSKAMIEIIHTAQSSLRLTPPAIGDPKENPNEKQIQEVKNVEESVQAASAPIITLPKIEVTTPKVEGKVAATEMNIQVSDQVDTQVVPTDIVEPGIFTTAHQVYNQLAQQIVQPAKPKSEVLLAQLEAEFKNSAPLPLVVAAPKDETQVAPPAPLAPVVPASPPAVQVAKVDPPTSAALNSSQEVNVKVTKAKSHIEAFSQSQKITGVSEQVFSYEGTRDRTSSMWIKLKREGYLNTLTLTGARGPFELPLISNNSVQLLYALTGVKKRESTGILFGKVAAGWEVQTSSNAEKIIYLNQQNQMISAQDLKSERSFVFLNAQPGVHLISALHVETGRTGAVAAPSLKGEATFVDLSEPRMSVVQGNVFDTASTGLKGSSEVRVEIVGQEGKFALTDHAGRFIISNVTLFSSYALNLEYEKKGGFRHRQPYTPEDAFSLARLYLFTTAQIDEILGQVAGGVSPESGLVMGALPQLGLELEKNKLYPGLTSLEADPLLHAETYVLGHDGQLLVKEPLLEANPRFVMLQAPEGMALVDAKTSQNETIWSQLIVSSPGVISLIGN